MSNFVEAVNKNGQKQRIPKAWLEDGSPFAADFRTPPSALAGPPTDSWKNSDISEWASVNGVDLGEATTKADMLAAIEASGAH